MSVEHDQDGNPAVYLGDGAYASHDGFALRVFADRDGVRHWVELEPEAIFVLVRFLAGLGFPVAVKK